MNYSDPVNRKKHSLSRKSSQLQDKPSHQSHSSEKRPSPKRSSSSTFA